MVQGDKSGRKESGPTKCRGCRNPVGANPVRIGRKPYHQECADKKPRYRQAWSSLRLEWERIGVWSDDEQATMEAHNGG